MKAQVNYPEAERAVIGSMMIEKWATQRGLQLLKIDDFDDLQKRLIFEAIGDIAEQEVDVVSVASQLRRMGSLDKAGGLDHLNACVAAVATTTYLPAHIKFVREASLQRKIEHQLELTSKESTSENVKELGDLIVALQGNRGGNIFDVRTDLGPLLDTLLEKPEPGLQTGIDAIDRRITGNLHPGELWTIGARPGGGKTALMLRLAGELAAHGVEVLYITMEMKTKEIVQRLLPMATHIAHTKFRTAEFTKDEIKRLIDVAGDMSELPLKLAYRSFPSIDDIRGTIFQAKPQVVFIDYLQRCQLPRAENMTYQIQAFYVALKNFLVDTGVIGFIGCQSDRELDKMPTIPPTLSHLKGSGAIESESDGVMMLWEPPPEVIAKRHNWVPVTPGNDPVEVIFRKNRNGPKNCMADLELDGRLIKICERQLTSEDMR